MNFSRCERNVPYLDCAHGHTSDTVIKTHVHQKQAFVFWYADCILVKRIYIKMSYTVKRKLTATQKVLSAWLPCMLAFIPQL